MDAKEYLESYAALKQEALNKEDCIFEAENEALIPAIAQGDGSQRTPGRGDRQEKANIRYIETKDRLQPIIDANRAEMRQIEDAINSLPDPMQREVLRLRYLDADGWKPVKWRSVAMTMYHDDDESTLRKLQYIHREAMAAIEAVLAAKEESRL